MYIPRSLISRKDLLSLQNNINSNLKSFIEKLSFDNYTKYFKVKYKQLVDGYYFLDQYTFFVVGGVYSFSSLSNVDSDYIDSILEKNNLSNDFRLLTFDQYKKLFYKESYSFLKNGCYKLNNNFIDKFLVLDNNDYKVINSNLEQCNGSDTNNDNVLVLLTLSFNESKINTKKEIVDFLLKNKLYVNTYLTDDFNLFLQIEKLFEDRDLLIDVLNNVDTYNDLSLKYDKFCLDNIIKDKLLNCDYNRIRASNYNDALLYTSNKGHWDIQSQNTNNDDQLVKFDSKFVARDATQDIVKTGVVAIDFGTQSTVVAYQKDSDCSYLLNLSYTVDSKNSVENPTVMQFMDLNSFIKSYKDTPARPYTNIDDLCISYEALSSFKGGNHFVIKGLKQWCCQKREKLILKDPLNTIIKLPEFLELSDNDFNPIEVYAYFIGCYINNLQKAEIYTNYLLSFPISFDQQTCNKLVESFKNGLIKSLPQSLAKNSSFISKFNVSATCSEPIAYALYALDKSNFLTELKDDKDVVVFGVYDFGGGTTDISFAYIKLSEEDRYFYELTVLGDKGHEALGGENILLKLAYQVCLDNIDELKAKGMTIFCPGGCAIPNVAQNIVFDTFESRYNLQNIAEKLRNFWENQSVDDFIKVNLINNNYQNEMIELEVDTGKLNSIIREQIQEGVDSFYAEFLTVVNKYNAEFENIKHLYIFLSGKASRHPLVKELFNQKLKQLLESELKNLSKDFFVLVDINKYKLDLKAGTAIGLLSSAKGSDIKINYLNRDDDDDFKYVIGKRNRNKMFVPVLYRPKNEMLEWVRLCDASSEEAYFLYSEYILVKDNIDQVSTSDPKIKKQRICTDVTDNSADIYIRMASKDTIEYMVAGTDLKPISQIKTITFS